MSEDEEEAVTAHRPAWRDVYIPPGPDENESTFGSRKDKSPNVAVLVLNTRYKSAQRHFDFWADRPGKEARDAALYYQGAAENLFWVLDLVKKMTGYEE